MVLPDPRKSLRTPTPAGGAFPLLLLLLATTRLARGIACKNFQFKLAASLPGGCSSIQLGNGTIYTNSNTSAVAWVALNGTTPPEPSLLTSGQYIFDAGQWVRGCCGCFYNVQVACGAAGMCRQLGGVGKVLERGVCSVGGRRAHTRLPLPSTHKRAFHVLQAPTTLTVSQITTPRAADR